MNTALWILAGLLAAAFLASGASKLFQPKEKVLASGAEFLRGFSPGSIKAIGLLEMLGAAGLVLPAALDIAPVLVPVAAIGLGLMMVGAIIAHVRRQLQLAWVPHLVVVALIAFLAWGRFGPESFTG